MIGLHPNSCQITWPRFAKHTALALVGCCFVGCSNQQMSASNPFMAPDRVPPPATRAIAPGTAAPYYPGSPVPAAQNAPPAPPIAQAAAIAPPAAVAMATPAPITPVSSSPQPLEFSNDRTVAIPTDNQDLRFALPAPPPIDPPSPQPNQTQVAQPTAPTPAFAAVPASTVVPAAFNQPVDNQQPMPTADASTNGPWRAPQVPGSASNVTQAQYTQPQSAQPTMLTAQQPQPPIAQPVPVELQPVASPQIAPTVSTPPSAAPVTPPPRMRFPSVLEPSTWFTPQPPAPNQQLIGYMVPGPDGQMHMVSVADYQASQAGGLQQPASVATADGFRPRGTSTK